MSSSRNYLVTALTGSIGTGKSAVASIMASLGAHLIDADLLAREVVAPGTPGLEAVVRRFGTGVRRTDGSLDRAALGAVVFGNPDARQDLESILHPAIRSLFLERLGALTTALSARTPVGATRHVILYVVPLYFESKLSWSMVDYVIVVAADPGAALQRIMRRDNCPEEVARRRMAAQLPIEEKVARADVVIRNDGTLADLERETLAAWQRLQTLPPRATG